MSQLEVYGSLPGIGDRNYLKAVIEIVQTCEKFNFTGALIQYNHKVPDPWVLTLKILQHSTKFIPLIAIQPYSMPPFTLAKSIASVAYLYNRRVYLNMISGSNPKELQEVGDEINHSERYIRLNEYIHIVKKLLSHQDVFTYEGDYYNYRNLRYFEPGIKKNILPKFFIGGSSDNGGSNENISLTNPEPIDMFKNYFVHKYKENRELGIRIGIITRKTDIEAWSVAKDYFPTNRLAYIRCKFNRESESSWKQRLALLTENEVYDQTYWLGSVLSGRSHSPFLVGNYEKVAEYLFRYIQCGVKHIILASPQEEYEENANVINIVKDYINKRGSKEAINFES
ncbi:LLM class flavin-dependent oxidoreductase [Fictibacillus nanhaiensis]|uniref:LLM class flavin-dependent oxidoreductase n=1 Tax=Fictibacillus nanhaiensis TaxID=742169 RepID=A0ABS2ZNG4_9BACL|nr:LLM class flavin-dependent oxidoreductase [Fictibacillus nanhaiensis]